MRTENWRIRNAGDFFFIEGDLPNAERNGHYPRVEVMQEDYGDHNGYNKEIRMSDAKLICAAPELLKACKNALKDVQKINKQLTEEGKHGYVLMENELLQAINMAGE